MTPTAFIRSWLIRQPRPASLRVACTDGTRVVPIAAGATWAQTAASVWALEPERIEALDSSGAVLRATRLGDEEDIGAAPAPAAPAAPAPLSTDPETIRFELFARLFTTGIKDAMAAAVGGQEVAFGKLVEIANVMGRRGEALEKSLASAERLLRAAWREQADLEAEVQNKQEPLTELVQSFMSGQAGGAAEHKTNGKA